MRESEKYNESTSNSYFFLVAFSADLVTVTEGYQLIYYMVN